MAAKKGPKTLTTKRPGPIQPRYVGSCEHKIAPFNDIMAKLRSDATPCPPDMKPDEAQSLLAQALKHQLYEGTHPANYVYAVSQARRMIFEGRLYNVEGQQYKGWPTEWEQVPDIVRVRMLRATLLVADDVTSLKSIEAVREEVLK